MTVRMFVTFALLAFASGMVQAESVTLLCVGKTFLSFERDGRRGDSKESDSEFLVELRGDALIRGEKSARCSVTEREIRCSAKEPDYEHSSVLNRYTGRMTMLEKLPATTITAVLTADVICSPSQRKF